MSASSCCVLLSKPELLGTPALSQALAAAAQIPFQDAARTAKNSWGFLAEGLEENAALDFAARLAAAGAPAFVLTADQLPPLPEPEQIGSISFEDSEFWVALRGESEKTAVPEPKLLSAAALKQTSVRSIEVKEGPTSGQKMMSMGLMMATGLPIKIGGKEQIVKKTVEDSELVFFMDLWLAEPRRRLRVNAQAFDFSTLKERMLHNVFGNFRTLLTDSAKAAPRAQLNRGARVLVESRPVREMGYETLEDWEKESRWLAALYKL